MEVQIDNQMTWIVAGAIAAAVLLLVAVMWIAIAKRRSRRRDTRLQEQFGAEYDRAISRRNGNKKAAEEELAGRLERVRSFEFRELEAVERERFQERWREVQSDFVDHPADALFRADALVTEVMRARGYADVSEGPGRRAADLSVYYSDEADEYRQFCNVAERGRTGTASTEELRLAMRRLRSVFEVLMRLPRSTTHDEEERESVSTVA